MERVDRASLNSALTTTGEQLQRRLPDEESTALGILLERMARRYPSQDVEDSMEEYLTDYEALVLRYTLQKVEEAVAALRIDPNQKFFPRPDEVAGEIERQRLKKVPSHVYARG